ncbi:hypothetical protein [Actinomadura hibisca]|uniref:hypothetical protein n=1 Tax=Actinomadura hibisca TaxID=68565 RepID=UPI000A0760EF|nr:hypothetical protein [Actinomadura hibisca]
MSLRAVTTMTPANWIESAITTFDSTVTSLVPRGFDAYARVLHPASAPDDRPVPWAEIAAWAGRELTPTSRFREVSRPEPDTVTGPAPWDGDPSGGELPPRTLRALLDVLAAHTATTATCWFCLWDGYGWIDGAGVVVFASAKAGAPPALPARMPAAFTPEVLDGPRVRLPHRDYLLLTGPLAAAADIGHRVFGSFFPQSPNLWWPGDRAWCTATEIDLDSTYVGGSSALVAALLDDPRLEALPVGAGDPIG